MSEPLAEQPSSFRTIVTTRRSGWRKYTWLIWALVGPGLLTMIGDNDAGGVIEYAVVGAQFGIGLFIPFVLCMAPLTYTIQDMTMRLGAVTQTGYTKLIFLYFGKAWGIYGIATLMIENLLTLMTEFIGMTAGLLVLGLPLWVADALSLALVLSLTLFAGYWTKERLALFVGALNVVFLIVAWLAHPSLAAIAHTFLSWHIPTWMSGSLVFYMIATLGNAVAPWMIFFQGSAVIDKGITKQDLRLGRIDTLLGSVLQVIVAIAIILCGSALFGRVFSVTPLGPASIVHALTPIIGHVGSALFAFGLFNAGFLAAITISLSSSWTLADALGWPRSLNDKISSAPKFYAVYIGSLVLAAGAILIPHLPFNLLAVFTQGLGAFVMVPILIFLLLLTSRADIMGEHVNGRRQKIWGWTIVSLLIGLLVVGVLML